MRNPYDTDNAACAHCGKVESADLIDSGAHCEECAELYAGWAQEEAADEAQFLADEAAYDRRVAA